MKILLASTASWKPPRGGSTRSNRAWISELRSAGHECRVAAPGALDMARLREHIEEFAPDWVLVSSEDWGQVLLQEALAIAPGRVVYLAHTPQMFPFGPASLYPATNGVALVQQCAAVVAICRYTADYIRRHAKVPVYIVHPPMYEGPAGSGSADGWIGFINPCAVKGLPIFLDIARTFPEYPFAALPGWGTTRGDRASLAAWKNVQVLPPIEYIGDFFARTRILLAPSLWPEGFGLVAIEAMLRGVPVIASDCGGLVDAKQGTDYLIPVKPIETYESRLDEHLLPVAVIPPQDIRPWLLAVRELMEEPGAYERASAAARLAAESFITNIEARGLEKLMIRLDPADRAFTAERAVGELLAGMSPDRRARLAMMVKQRKPT